MKITINTFLFVGGGGENFSALREKSVAENRNCFAQCNLK